MWRECSPQTLAITELHLDTLRTYFQAIRILQVSKIQLLFMLIVMIKALEKIKSPTCYFPNSIYCLIPNPSSHSNIGWEFRNSTYQIKQDKDQMPQNWWTSPEWTAEWAQLLSTHTVIIGNWQHLETQCFSVPLSIL